jgi:diguanylate cyclase (GGDEF)-like protein/PAS domain S-box-containing protein
MFFCANALSVLKERQVLMPDTPGRGPLLEALLESMNDAVLSISLEGRIESWSGAAERLYGYAEEEIIGHPIRELMPVYEVPALAEALAEAKRGTIRPCETTERLRKNGTKTRVEIRRSAIRDERNEIAGILENTKELNWRKSEVPEETQLRLMAQQMPGVVWTTDLDLKITSIWGSGLAPSRMPPKQLIGRSICEYFGCGDRHSTPIVEHEDALQGLSSHFEYQRSNHFLEVHVCALRSASGEVIGTIGIGVDITARKKSEDDIRYQATHDALTGLANYREFIDSLEREVRRADRSRQSFTILLLDLDDLKKINDRHGHLAGNRALKRLSNVMKAHCRSTDLAARYGGDEFAALLIDSDLGMAEHVARRIQTGLQNEEETPSLTVSIGIAVYPQDGRTAPELLEVADQQLYRRKKLLKRRIMTAS